MKLEKFVELFGECSADDKIAMFNEYQNQHRGGDDTIYSFDEEFFYIAFSDPMEAARATFFGDIESWSDPYIRFNGYGNLESLSETEAEQEADDAVEEIFDHPDIWVNYIDDDEETDDDWEDED